MEENFNVFYKNVQVILYYVSKNIRVLMFLFIENKYFNCVFVYNFEKINIFSSILINTTWLCPFVIYNFILIVLYKNCLTQKPIY